MRGINQFSSWFSKQSLGGKLLFGITSGLAFCCLCGILPAITSPANQTSEATKPIPLDASGIQTAIFQTAFAIITQTAIADASTETITITPESTLTETAPPTSTQELMATLPALEVLCIPETTLRQEGDVTNIVDGDTVDVAIDGQTYRVRYIGIDTPEKNENYYDQATSLNRGLVYNKHVLLVKDVSETDRYDRLLRYVVVGNIFVNSELVRQGYARASTYPPDVACSEFFAVTQNQAQSAQLGLWISAFTLPSPVSSGNNNGGNCHPSYPTVCIPPPPPDLDCKDVSFRGFQVLPPDPHRFDGDDDGIGCES